MQVQIPVGEEGHDIQEGIDDFGGPGISLQTAGFRDLNGQVVAIIAHVG